MALTILSQFTDKKIWDMMRPYIKRVLTAILFSLAASGASGAIAWLVKPVIDSIFVEQNYGMLTWLPMAILATYFLRGSCQMICSYLMRSAGIKLVRDTRIRLYTHLLHLPTSALGTESSGKMISRILNDAAVLNALISDTLLTIFKEMPTIIILLGVALYRRWDVTLIALVAVPGIVSCAHRLGRSIKEKRNQAQQTIAVLTHRISEAATGSKVIKVFTSEEPMAKQFVTESQSNYRREVKIVRLREIAKMVVDISTGLGVGLVIWYGGNLVTKGLITTGDLFSALGAVAMIFSPIKNLGNSYTVFQEIRAAVERLSWLENMKEEKSGDHPLPSFQKKICFQDVCHRYRPDGELILNDINLTINRGDVVAIVGASGAGKTTMIDLLPRFYDPTSGRILMDDRDIREIRLTDLRQKIGMVSQDVMLFNDTIRANISFGSPDATDTDIKEAARQAFAHDFIAELPAGYDTLLGERGLNLSGGQRQRLAIARAILKNPPILILDEATSALDAVSEQLVQKALDTLMQDRTTIVVAHRLSTIRNADRIVVMEHGQIISQGSHEELMTTSAVYQELYLSYNRSAEVRT
ncbi:MAG: ABC transporter ATP-binding protein/permease [Proteobacteria bacterium]|nr:ABC transporter ATP-binding protein/permease [Pseudomonadota bacterium]MBU1641562.1 ABC transporter ATP-binding protein/permease [Pseudomonadota bacterium]